VFATASLLLAACGTTLHRLPAEPAEVNALPELPAIPPTASVGSTAPAEQPQTEGPKAEPEEGTSLADQPPPEPLPGDNVLENARRSVRSSTEWLARGVDSWFGDQPFWEGGGQVRDGRLSIGVLKRQGEGLDTRVRFNARVRLPNVERRAYVFVGRDNEREVVADTPGAFSRQDRLLPETREDRSFFTGLGVGLRDNIDLRLGFHGIKPYAQARYRQPWSLSDRDLVEFRQTFFWRVSDRFGSTTALSYEHALSATLAARWLTAITGTQKTKEWDWSSIVGTYKSFGAQRLLAFEAISSGRLGAHVTFGEYGVQTKWEQPIYRDWLIGEFLTGYFWPRFDVTSERTRRWALGFTTTMRF
jgi:hypothetical protein